MRTLIEASIHWRPCGWRCFLAAALSLLCGCSKDPAAPIFESGAFAGTWQGSVIVTTSAGVPTARGAAGEQGPSVLDLRAVSRDRLDGTVVMRWPGLSDEVRAQVGGTAAGSNLTLSTTGGGHPVTLQLSRVDSTHLAGTFTSNVGQGVTGSIELGLVPVAHLQSNAFLDLRQVLAMAFDADTLWLSTIGDDYILASRGGTIADTVPVFYRPDTHWTSDVLTAGGGKLWGHLRLTSGQSTVSHMLPFRREGILPGDFYLPHLSYGLAHDGTDLWSLYRPTQTLYRVTEAGAVVDSVRVANPDLLHLEWDGSHFWSMGWFIPLLWKIAPTGEVVGVYRLPTDLSYPTGLAFDGQYLYCAQSDLSVTRIIRLSATTPIP